MQTSRSYNNFKAKSEIAFNPVVDFNESVQRAVFWLKEQGKLKTRV